MSGFKVEFEGGKEGLERLTELAIEGSPGTYLIGQAEATPPLTGIKATMQVNEDGSFTFEAVMAKAAYGAPIRVKVKPLQQAGFRVSAGDLEDWKPGVQQLVELYRAVKGNPVTGSAGLHSPRLPRHSMIGFSGIHADAANLTYKLNLDKLEPEQVGNAISECGKALELIVNGAYSAAHKPLPQGVLTLDSGSQVQRINKQRTQPAAPAKPQGPAPHDGEVRLPLEAMTSDLTFKHIGGYQGVKEQFGDFLQAIEDPEEARRQGYTPSKGWLLHGPPGTGKTMFGKALAGEARAEFIYFNAADALQMYVGQSTKTLKAAFEGAQKRAGETGKPVILFIDEIDSVFPERGTAHDVKTDLVNLFNQYMDGFESRRIPGVYVVAATNRLHDMDESATRAGRFVKVEVKLPDLEARTAIFQVTKEALELKAGTQLFDPAIDYRLLAQKADDSFSGADIAQVMQNSRQKAFRQAAKGEVIVTPQKDLEAEIAAYRSQGKEGNRHLGFRTG